MTFAQQLDPFRVEDTGHDLLTLHHHFELPATVDSRGMTHIKANIPWTISRAGTRWIYDGYRRYPAGPRRFMRAEWDADHTCGEIYHENDAQFRRGRLTSLTGMPTDQILLARVMANRTGCLIHASGVAIDDEGLLFVGHSSAGKSTIARQLSHYGKVIAEDRVAVRCMPDGFALFSTWCQFDLPTIDPITARLRAVCFIEKSETNRAILLTDRQEILRRLIPCLVKPFTDAEWWNMTLTMIDLLVQQVPIYRLPFNHSGRIAEILSALP